ncbi:MAG: glycosyltransferase family 2 protein [Cyanobacteria bacterium]|nr:glycosyltransferase family 2 protein [Cyanobacteriota bacterium]
MAVRNSIQDSGTTALARTPADGSAVTALILTFNEESNIARTLAGLDWVDHILVVDSGSSDATLAILQGTPGVEIAGRRFDCFENQRNFGLSRISTPWVLSLDADYGISPRLAAVLRHAMAVAPEMVSGFSLPFRYCIQGQPLRGTLLPARTVLFRHQQARYVADGHAEALQLPGEVWPLAEPILHDDRKPLTRWLTAQPGYLLAERQKLLSTPSHQLSLVDRLRKHSPLAPLVVGVYCLLIKGNLWDGARGLFYTAQRIYAELLLLLFLLEGRTTKAQP